MAIGPVENELVVRQQAPEEGFDVRLLAEASSAPAEDTGVFVDAILLNWLIGGTAGRIAEAGLTHPIVPRLAVAVAERGGAMSRTLAGR